MMPATLTDPILGQDDVYTEAAQYFRSLGYRVEWDYKNTRHPDGSTTTHAWLEIVAGGNLVVQIDMNAPLADLKTDLPLLVRGEPSTCASNWEVRGELDELRNLVDSMRADAVRRAPR
jgi:hypothetical protein